METVIQGNWSETLRGMRKGEKVIFPVHAIASVTTIISRLKLEMCVIGADWKRLGIDKKKGTFTIQRTA